MLLPIALFVPLTLIFTAVLTPVLAVLLSFAAGIVITDVHWLMWCAKHPKLTASERTELRRRQGPFN
jgi:hypothetical protein